MAKKAFARVDCEHGIMRKGAALRVFETARNLFYQRGVRAVGVEEIVCEAGVTKPSLYRAFGSKDELLAACLTESAREGREELLAALDAAPPEPRAQLRALVAHYAGRIASPDFRGCPMSNIAVELPDAAHPLRLIMQDCKTDLRATIVEMSRALGSPAPGQLADGLILTIEGAFASYHVYGSQGPALALTVTCDALIDAHMERAAN